MTGTWWLVAISILLSGAAVAGYVLFFADAATISFVNDDNPRFRAAGRIISFAISLVVPVGIVATVYDPPDPTKARLAELKLARSGETGKGEDFNLLFQHGQSFSEFDLSCDGVGETRSDHCYMRAIFADIAMTHRAGTVGMEQVGKVDFSGNLLLRFAMQDVNLDAVLDQTTIINSVIFRSVIAGTRGTIIRWSDITGSFVGGDVCASFTMVGVNISGSELPGIGNCSPLQLRDFYYWADQPPMETVAVSTGILSFTGSDLTVARLPMGKSDAPATVKVPMRAEVLKFMTICAPPQGYDLRPKQLEARLNIPIRPERLLYQTCKPMTLDQAVAAFPDSYTRR
ncbi:MULTISPECIES: hypothetical protein [unclassified Mesorhizobium]|uniref:hypothetical protein n=1 Tax=unclassified Mesorhizobium TaxID=325217 RepID=UPI00112AC994|nr:MULTISPECIES: hypothetical protein [unclassified Mesorhizobium]TPK93964.1 hypothetical protein FJ567_25390 [Mesorhizobium sp. B2-4-16]TPL60611.1 hypothetical protein FJ956_27480 [Mesorhizobium sp. B2-4-3]